MCWLVILARRPPGALHALCPEMAGLTATLLGLPGSVSLESGLNSRAGPPAVLVTAAAHQAGSAARWFPQEWVQGNIPHPT